MLKVTDEAATYLKALRAKSNLVDPVASLQHESSNYVPPVISEVAQGLDGRPDLEALSKLAYAEFEREGAALQWRLTAGFFERAELEKADVVALSGVPFCLPQQMLAAMDGWILDVSESGLFLRRDIAPTG